MYETTTYQKVPIVTHGDLYYPCTTIRGIYDVVCGALYPRTANELLRPLLGGTLSFNDTTSLDVRSLPKVIDLGSQMPGSVSTNRTLRFVRLFN
jgi:hypothetical protein